MRQPTLSPDLKFIAFAYRGDIWKVNVEGGRAYLVKVPGTRQTPLSDERVAKMLNWLLPHFDAAHMPKDFTPYTGDEVKALRAEPLADVMATRAQLIKALEEKASH